MRDSLYGFIMVSLSPTPDFLKALQSLGHLQNNPKAFFFKHPQEFSASKTYLLYFCLFVCFFGIDICACDIKPDCKFLRTETGSCSSFNHTWHLAHRKGFHQRLLNDECSLSVPCHFPRPLFPWRPLHLPGCSTISCCSRDRDGDAFC